jgi:DNA-binding transcriptional ArsR family regulator
LVLYSRFSKRDILASKTRQRILKLVEENPGIHMRALAAQLGFKHPSVAHHVRKLEESGVLRVVHEGRKAKLYRPHEVQASPGEDAPVHERILHALRRSPQGCTRHEIHELFPDVSRRIRNKALQRLLKQRIVHEDEPEALDPKASAKKLRLRTEPFVNQ